MKKEIKYNSFIIYASALDAIESIENPIEANEVLRAVVEHAIYGEHTALRGDLEAVAKLIINDIARAQGRYEKNKEEGIIGGSRVKYHTEDILTLVQEGMSNEEIAATLGCTVRTVQRKLAAAQAQPAVKEKGFNF